MQAQAASPDYPALINSSKKGTKYLHPSQQGVARIEGLRIRMKVSVRNVSGAGVKTSPYSEQGQKKEVGWTKFYFRARESKEKGLYASFLGSGGTTVKKEEWGAHTTEYAEKEEALVTGESPGHQEKIEDRDLVQSTWVRHILDLLGWIRTTEGRGFGGQPTKTEKKSYNHQ